MVDECTLISYSHQPSTLRTNVAPIVGSNGNVSCAVYTTGHTENFTTLWDCGKFGRVTSQDKKLFQFGKPRMVLLIRHSSYDTRIVGYEESRD